MYEVKVQCVGVPPEAAQSGLDDILDEFKHRPWHTNVRCHVDSGVLVLTAVNDYDTDGLALLDEFSDAVVACLELGGATVSFQVQSVTPLAARG
jgi:hypothetical protein